MLYKISKCKKCKPRNEGCQIFDYDLTDDELELLTYGLSESDYDKVSSIESKIIALAALFGRRGDKEKSKLYLGKLNDDFVKTNIKWDSWING